MKSKFVSLRAPLCVSLSGEAILMSNKKIASSFLSVTPRNDTLFRDIDQIILNALREDAAFADVTTNCLIPSKHRSSARIIFKSTGIICGLKIAQKVFQTLDKNIKFKTRYKDGDTANRGAIIAEISGKTRALLAGERTALNFLSYLSGISTNTHQFVQAIRPFKTKILDTRKTTPGLRRLEKYAVHCGGGVNHRMNLKDMVLVKDNHREFIASWPETINKLRGANAPIEIDVDTIAQLKKILPLKPDFILLDNMKPSCVKMSVAIVKQRAGNKRPLLEASGGITLKNVRAYPRTGVDRISIGSLTMDRRAIDVSMEIQKS